MDLIYKIYSVWLYDNQLDHDYLFFYNRKKTYFGGNEPQDVTPYSMFGSSIFCANFKIYNMDKSDPLIKEKSIELMFEAARSEGVLIIKATDFITLIPCGESHISYSGPNNLYSQEIIKEGKYKGLVKNTYTPYDIMWNETKSGINPHQWEIAGVWNAGKSQHSSYRIWEERKEREKIIRDYKLNLIGIK